MATLTRYGLDFDNSGEETYNYIAPKEDGEYYSKEEVDLLIEQKDLLTDSTVNVIKKIIEHGKLSKDEAMSKVLEDYLTEFNKLKTT